MIVENEKIDTFLSQYDDQVFSHALELREIIFKKLPDIQEQLDLPAKMLAYCYGQKYAELICTIIPSKKGLKLGFNRGIDLDDPENLLQGTGKISRYVEIITIKQIKSAAIKKLLLSALKAYNLRNTPSK